MSELRRYEATLVHKCGENPYMVMASADDGDYCEYQQAADEITRLRQLLSEAEKREREARKKLQAMHRRAQESERVEQMIFDTLGTWHKLYNEGQFKPRARRALFFVVMKVLKSRSEKIRHRRAALERSEG